MIDFTRNVTVRCSGAEVVQLVDQQVFAYGTILLLRKDHCVVLIKAGPKAGKKITMPLVFPATIDGVTYYANIAPVEADASPAVQPKARSKRVEGVKTKIEVCREIYAAYPVTADLKADKAAIIQKFITEAHCTAQGAVTYYNTCSKG